MNIGETTLTREDSFRSLSSFSCKKCKNLYYIYVFLLQDISEYSNGISWLMKNLREKKERDLKQFFPLKMNRWNFVHQDCLYHQVLANRRVQSHRTNTNTRLTLPFTSLCSVDASGWVNSKPIAVSEEFSVHLVGTPAVPNYRSFWLF